MTLKILVRKETGMIKKLFIIMLTLSMCITYLPSVNTTAFAEEEKI